MKHFRDDNTDYQFTTDQLDWLNAWVDGQIKIRDLNPDDDHDEISRLRELALDLCDASNWGAE